MFLKVIDTELYMSPLDQVDHRDQRGNKEIHPENLPYLIGKTGQSDGPEKQWEQGQQVRPSLEWEKRSQ